MILEFRKQPAVPDKKQRAEIGDSRQESVEAVDLQAFRERKRWEDASRRVQKAAEQLDW